MINWLYQTGLDVSLLIGIVLLLRNPVRKYLGANITYWLWIIPLVRLIVWKKTEIPLAILEKVSSSDGRIFIRVFNNPENYNLSSYLTVESIWITGAIIWLSLRIIGLTKFHKNLVLSRSKISPKEIASLGINNSEVDFYFTNYPAAPFLTGIFQPQIYLPKNYFEELNHMQQQCIIKHELIHYQT